jgi:hypothetical protein
VYSLIWTSSPNSTVPNEQRIVKEAGWPDPPTYISFVEYQIRFNKLKNPELTYREEGTTNGALVCKGEQYINKIRSSYMTILRNTARAISNL